MVTLESIERKLGFNPLDPSKAVPSDTEDDGQNDPFRILSIEELDFIYNEATKNANKEVE